MELRGRAGAGIGKNGKGRRRRLSRAARLAILFAGLAISSTPPGLQAAAMFRAGPALTGRYDAPAVRSLGGIVFTYKTGQPIRSTPALSGGILYFGSDDGFLHAIDAHTGQQLWRFGTGGMIRSSPAIAAGFVYFTSRDGNLYALSAQRGVLKWKRPIGADLGSENYWDFFNSSPIPVGGRLFIGSGDGHLYCLDAATGHTIWAFPTGARIRSTPAVADGTVVFGTMSGNVDALDAATGRRKWTFATRGASHKFSDRNNDTTSLVIPPAVADGIVVVGGRDSYVYGLDLATGRKLWDATQDGSSWILSLGIADGIVYVGGGSASLTQALDLRTGKEKWRFATRGAVFTPIAIAGGAIYFSDFAGTAYALDAATGKDLWRYPVGDRSFAGPAAADGMIYFASDNGVLLALRGRAQPVSSGEVRRAVYWQGRKSDQDFSWFENDVDLSILHYFQGAGYRQIGEPQLRDFLEAQVRDHGRSVLVLSDSRLPEALVEEAPEQSPIRRYLDAGGKLVMVGINPLALHYDPKEHQVDRIDYDYAARVSGVIYPPRSVGKGYYTSNLTRDGIYWGLRGPFVSSDMVDPHQPITVLALDEFGMASSWAKNYGGPEGTGLVQLTVPRSVTVDLAPFLAAAEHGMK